jgi:hypothetical protein
LRESLIEHMSHALEVGPGVWNAAEIIGRVPGIDEVALEHALVVAGVELFVIGRSEGIADGVEIVVGELAVAAIPQHLGAGDLACRQPLQVAGAFRFRKMFTPKTAQDRPGEVHAHVRTGIVVVALGLEIQEQVFGIVVFHRGPSRTSLPADLRLGHGDHSGHQFRFASARKS